MRLFLTAASIFLAILTTADASAAAPESKLLHSSSGLEVLKGDTSCESRMSVNVRSENPEVHFAGGFTELQVALKAARDKLLTACPTVSLISFVAANAGGTPLYEGTVRKSQSWRLEKVWEIEDEFNADVKVLNARKVKNRDNMVFAMIVFVVFGLFGWHVWRVERNDRRGSETSES